MTTRCSIRLRDCGTLSLFVLLSTDTVSHFVKCEFVSMLSLLFIHVFSCLSISPPEVRLIQTLLVPGRILDTKIQNESWIPQMYKIC
jgi:hypothetical protein